MPVNNSGVPAVGRSSGVIVILAFPSSSKSIRCQLSEFKASLPVMLC